MGILLVLIVCGLAIWLWWYLAEQFYQVAKMKGYPERKYFWLCFITNFAGYLLVIALPDRGNTTAAISDELPDL